MRLSLLPNILTWSPRDVRGVYFYRHSFNFPSPGQDDFGVRVYPAQMGRWVLLHRVEARIRRTGGISSNALFQVHLGASYHDGTIYDYWVDSTPLNSWVVFAAPLYVTLFLGDYVGVELYFGSPFIGVIQPCVYGNVYDL